MRRLLLVFLSILLPLQFSWAGAAAYCAHESADQPAAMTSHFGHHSHEHKADQHDAGKTAGKAAKLPDADCTACHFPGSHGLFGELHLPGDYRYVTLRYAPRQYAFGSIPAPVPDRPQWPHLA